VNKNIADIDPVTGELIYPTQKNKNAEYHQYGLLQEVYAQVGKDYDLSVSYWFQNNKRSLPRLNTYEGDDFSNQNKQSEQTHRAIAKLTKYGKKNTTECASGIVTSNSNYSLENFINGLGFQKAIDSDSKYFTSYNKLSYTYNLDKKNSLKFNYNLNYHTVSSVEKINKTGYEAIRWEHLLFAHWSRNWTPRLKSDIMLRANRIDGENIPLIPYLGLNYELFKKQNVNLKASVSKNYRQPTLNDLYWQPGGNLDLLPEQGVSSDVGLTHLYKHKNLVLKSEITLYYSEIRNWIIWLPTVQGFWQPQNIQRVQAKGLEYHLKGSWSLKKVLFNFNTNYAYTLSTNQGDTETWGEDAVGKQLPYVPIHSFNFYLKTTYRGFFVSYVHNSYSERFTTASNDVSRRDWLYPYFMNSLYVGKELSFQKNKLLLEFKIYNLFNEEYRSVLGRPMPGRNYLLTLMFKF
jgi:iron complex outermembrane receptor protein